MPHLDTLANIKFNDSFGSPLGFLLDNLITWRRKLLASQQNLDQRMPVYVLAKGSLIGISALRDIPGYTVIEYEGKNIPFDILGIEKEANVDLSFPYICYLFAGHRSSGRIRVSVTARNLPAL